MYHYFIFDMDGTLVDTTDGILAALQRLQQVVPLKCLPEETLRKFIGPPLKTSLVQYYGVALAQTEELTRVYRQCYMEVGIDKTQVFPQTPEILRRIRASGCKSAIATLKQHQLASRTLRHTGLDQLVDYIALNLDNSVGDKAAMIGEALEKIGCSDKTQALMVGDSPFDGYAAQDAGVDFLPLTCGEGFRDRTKLDEVRHIATAGSMAELLTLIHKMTTVR